MRFRHAAAGSLSLARTLRDTFFTVLFPTRCPLCEGEVSWSGGLGICRACWQHVRRFEGSTCTTCGLPIVAESAEPGLCGACRSKAFSFDRARSYGIYSFPLRDLILHLKFRRRERWGDRLGRLLANLAEEQGWSREEHVIVPVPLHPSREQERGYNQAELLGEGLLRGLRELGCSGGSRLESRALVRVRRTAPQSGLSHQARQENVRGVFSVRHPERVCGRRVLLVDDVMTTGATVSACAAALKRSGALEVRVLTLARSTPQFPDSAWPEHRFA